MPQTNALPEIDEVPPLDAEDLACFNELKEVLKKHGKVERFGLNLMHQHFTVNDDEILFETCDAERRTLMVRPIKRSQLEQEQSRPTSWRLDLNEPTMNCVCPVVNGAHAGQHVHTQ